MIRSCLGILGVLEANAGLIRHQQTLRPVFPMLVRSILSVSATRRQHGFNLLDTVVNALMTGIGQFAVTLFLRMNTGASNTSPCDYYGDPVKECTCSPTMVARYQKRISGPLLDRVDIHVEVPRVEYEKLADDRLGEPSSAIRARVETSKDLQRQRFLGTRLACNAEMTWPRSRDFCQTDPAAQGLLKAAMNQLHLSARAFHRVLKLARTIADLAHADIIGAPHLAEAIQYWPRGGG